MTFNYFWHKKIGEDQFVAFKNQIVEWSDTHVNKSLGIVIEVNIYMKDNKQG
jgi:hypothetical protein